MAKHEATFCLLVTYKNRKTARFFFINRDRAEQEKERLSKADKNISSMKIEHIK